MQTAYWRITVLASVLVMLVLTGAVRAQTLSEFTNRSHAADNSFDTPAGAAYAPLDGLAAGSAEAQQHQRKAVAKLGLPLAVRTKKTGIVFRLIPAGTFVKGSPAGEPGRDRLALLGGGGEDQREVTLTRPFWCGQFEVTQQQWEQVMGNNPSRFKEVGSNAPVENVTWDACEEFLGKLEELEGAPPETFRLLTDAEWEYACRAGTTSALYVGNLTSVDGECTNLDRVGWYAKNSGGKTHPVGKKLANAWGLYDMHGNVWELCQDWMSEYPPGPAATDAEGSDTGGTVVGTSIRLRPPMTDPQGPDTGGERVGRGGSWINETVVCRAAFRGRLGRQGSMIGLRLVLTVTRPKEAAAVGQPALPPYLESVAEAPKPPLEGMATGSAGGQSAAMKLDYPPTMKLQQQAIVTQASSETGCVRGRMPTSVTERGYDAVYFGIEPADPTRGTRWMAYDSARKTPVVLIEDLNVLCGQSPVPGVLGQRVHYAALGSGGRGNITYLGTGPAEGQGSFPGGHMIRNEKDLGAVEAGWAVVDIRTDGRAAVALGGAPDGGKFRLYRVARGKLVAMGIEGGPELREFSLDGRTVLYRGADKQVYASPLDGNEAPATQPAEALPPTPRPPTLKAIPENLADVGPNLAAMYSHNQELVRAAKVQDGIYYYAVEGQSNQLARLFCWMPAAGAPVELGALNPIEGQPVTRVYQLRMLPSGDVNLLVGNGKCIAIQTYLNPLMSLMAAMSYADMEPRWSKDPLPAVKVRTVQSFYQQAENGDRSWGGYGFASDGKLYMGPMPHHPTDGAPIFRYDPAKDRIETLGIIDDISGNSHKAGLMVNMIHTHPVEIKGKVYFLGQDPFYGAYGFPGMNTQNMHYAGSPLVAYSIKERKFEFLGIPLAGRSLFGVAAAPDGKMLYLGSGYGIHQWYGLALDGKGRPRGEPKKLNIPRAGDPVVGADGKLYFGITRSDGEDKYGPPCDLVCYDPAADKCETVASFDLADPGIGFTGGRARNPFRLLPGQDGQPVVYAIVEALQMVIKFDLRAGKVSPVGQWHDEPGQYHYDCTGIDLKAGKVYWLVRTYVPDFPESNCRLYTLDVATGTFIRHGVLRDQKDRRFIQITAAASGPDGRLFMSGEVYALPEDPYFAFRQRTYGERFKRDCCLHVLDRLP